MEPGADETGRPPAECPTCGKTISRGVNACPECGQVAKAPGAEQTSNGWSVGIIVGGLMVIAGLVLAWLSDFHTFRGLTLFFLFFGSLLFFGCEIAEWLSRDVGDSRAGDGASAKGEDCVAASENAIPNDDKE